MRYHAITSLALVLGTAENQVYYLGSPHSGELNTWERVAYSLSRLRAEEPVPA